MKKLFALSSLALTVTWLVLRATGFVRYASVLSGTLPEGETSLATGTDRAVVLLVVHVAFVLLAAPLALSAACLHALEARDRRAAQAKRAARDSGT
ncbi:MAG: hypothetical protein JNK05_05450 [Myxococcales bacterium]|nr:hypothetical protein [Myxococcales bacterium]